MFLSAEAHQRLAPYIDENYAEKRLRRLALLPGALNKLAVGLLGIRRANEHIDSETYSRRQRQALKDLGALRAPERKRLFAALFPSIAAETEAAWQLFDRLPYQSGTNRRPFRLKDGAGGAAAATSRRSAWVQQLASVVAGFDQPANWFAEWAAYLGWNAPDALGYLFAGVIERGGAEGQQIFDILCASARGDHPVGKMGRHVSRALLSASRPEGWQVMERLLLAAQREEGLRQVILETLDEAHPQAFLRLLGVILDQNLLRFSAVVRAAAVWVGLPFEAANPKEVLAVMLQLRAFLTSPAARQAALQAGAAQEAYLALWAIAFEDAPSAVSSAAPLLSRPDPEGRFVAAFFLSQVRLLGSLRAGLPALADPDLRVAACTFASLSYSELDDDRLQVPDLFEQVEAFVQRLPEKEKSLPPIVWDWMAITIDRKEAATLLAAALGDRPAERLLPYLSYMSPSGKIQVAQQLILKVDSQPQVRAALLALVTDRDSYVQREVNILMGRFVPQPEEVSQLEALLTRKSVSIRRTVIELLLNLPDAAAFESLDRLLAQRSEQQRLAGLEMLRAMAGQDRAPAGCLARVARLQAVPLTDAERHILADLLVQNVESYTLDNALGLANPANFSQPATPRTKNALFGLVKKTRLGSKAAGACILALDGLVDQHRAEPIETVNWQDVELIALLGNANGGLRNPDPALSPAENLARFPLAEIWETWLKGRPAAQRDEDGFELLRAQAALTLVQPQFTPGREWTRMVPKELRTFLDESYNLSPKYDMQVASILRWLEYLHPAPNSADFLLDAVEELCFRFTRHDQAPVEPAYNLRSKLGYLTIARSHRRLHPQDWQARHHARFWGLVQAFEPVARRHESGRIADLEDLLLAHKAGAATQDDLFRFLLARQDKSYYGSRHFPDLRLYSGKRLPPLAAEYPVLPQVIDSCRERILAIELRRGDLPTAASSPALALRSVPGMETMLRLLGALGKADFDRRMYYFDDNRVHVLSYLIRVSYPLENDSLEDFADLAKSVRIPENRLVELAVYAPQWARHVEQALGWPGMADGVWWVYAHTKDRQWQVDEEIRGAWRAEIGEHTPLSIEALLDGAVDVAWFQRMLAGLGEQRWQSIYAAARLASSGTGHSRARLFADAMLGRLEAEELSQRVQSKRNQDALRALGLAPLPNDETRQSEILRRYQGLQEFIRTSKQFGSQRQASEKQAAGIAMENLARTAGFPDPLRLEWAMELEAVADLAAGPVSAEAEGVTVALSIDDLGEAQISVQRGEKALKSIPPAVKKDARILALMERKQELQRQAQRMRLSLEAAMVRGDEFEAGEIQALFRHPLLRVMLEQLIFVSPYGLGYPVEGGKALEGLGQRIRLDGGSPAPIRLRLAHPYDLLKSGGWHAWQQECFLAERIQPFKQVFRELYLLTPTEQDDGNFSRRYAGQQVNPRQALALFGRRGWVVAPEDGVYKTFHEVGITARVGFLQAIFTPAEVEGLTIELVGFTNRDMWLPLKLDQVPPRLFSEVMRDLDLVVSVAHAGGVDPEASASSLEARAALVQETCALLKLSNVRLENRHALVDGKLGNYTIHLGSAVVHKQPGGALCIVPVHSQQRGRLFLPFVDNDPKTAEVVSKVILLAKDNEIKDPTILEQILK